MFVLVLSLAIAACGSRSLTITFETNGGTEIAPIKAAAGADISALLPEEPTREGFFFEGWYLEADFSGEAQDLPAVMPEKSVTYYAKWAEGAGAKLTLTTNNGGTLQRTQYNVKVGENLLEFLADKAPTPKTGLTFAGWYRGNNKVTASDTMSAAGMTLTAKYNATYKVEVYRQNTAGGYDMDEEVATGTAIYGEPFSCDNFEYGDVVIEDGTVTAPSHFTLGPGGRMETDSLGVDDTFSIYLDRDTFYVVYDANVPAGERVVTDVMSTDIYVHGGNTKLGECGYVLSGHYRFLGWSTATDVASAAELQHPGDPVVDTGAGNLTYYAIWEKGYADVFDGGDVIYIDKFAPTTLHLEREGMEIKDGTLEADLSFAFEIDEDLTLNGKLIEDEENDGQYTYFFYYRDTYAKTYTDMDGTSATLTMFEDGTVMYRPNGTDDGMLTGKYTINGDGYFVFEDATNAQNNFLFNLYTMADGDEHVVFRRQSTEELGYYYDAEANIILYLDGLGGLRYYYHKSNAEYTGFDGNFTYVAFGYYELQHHTNAEGDILENEGDIFVAQTRDIASVLKQFTFKDITTTGATVTKADFPDLPQNATVKGTVDMDDTVRGRYTSKWGESENTLKLDGYGHGTFGDAEGACTLFTWRWSVEGENGDSIETYYLVRFTPTEGDDITYFRMDLGNGEYIVDRTITAAQSAAYTGATGRFDLDIDPDDSDDWFFILNMSFPKGFVMIYENGDAEVWTLYGTAYPDETNRDIVYYVYYLEPALARDVEKVGDIYHFAQGGDPDDLNQFDFKIVEGKVQVVLPEQHDIATIDTVDGQTLTLDYTTRTAKLGTQEVDYWYTIGYLDLYTFRVNGSLVYYWTEGTYAHPSASHGSMTFTKINANSMYLAKITPELEETSYIGMFLFLNGTHEGETYFAYLLDSGLYRIVGKGTTTKGDNEDYEYSRTDKLPDMENSEFEGYDNFIFRLSDERQISGDDNIQTFVLWHSELTYSNFTSDGYGTYSYTNGSATRVGVISFTIGSGNGRLIYFTVNDTQETLILRVSGSSVVEVFDYMNSGDAGYWYLLDSNQNIRENTYLVFDGNGVAYLYEYDSMTDTTKTTQGTYARTSKFRLGPYIQGGFMEYRITLRGAEDDDTQTYLLDPSYTVVDTTTGYTDEIPLYQQLIPHRVGSFYVHGGGRIESVGYPGYPVATYVNELGETLMGNMYIGKVNTDTDDHGFINDVAGTKVHFWALARGTESVSEDYYFNIVDGELVPLVLPYGDYALYANGSVVSGLVLRLDGVSAASILANGTELWRGTYTARGTSEFVFSGEGVGAELEAREFTFRLSTQTAGGETTYVFEEEDETMRNIVLTNDDWTVLVLNGYGDAHYINKYGDVIIGTFTLFDKEHGYGAFESTLKTDVFQMNGTTMTYEFLNYDRDYAAAYYAANFSSVVLTGTRFIIEGVEYFYTVSQEKAVTLYKPTNANSGVTFVKQPETVALPIKGTTYTYNQKQYLAYTAGEELTFTNDAYATSITLKFTPDGAAFAVAATFASGAELAGYRVVVSYDGGFKAMLTYLAGGMDSRVEEYALTLNYAGMEASSTFTVEPKEKGTFKRYADGSAKDPMKDNNDTVVIAEGHIGALNLAPKSGNALTVTLGIKDNDNTALHYEGSLDNVRVETESNFMGSVRALTLTGSDKKSYVLRFWLYNNKFVVHSVVVESTFSIDGIDVTFMQLWESGTHYTGGEKFSLVGISAARSSTEEVKFMGALDENTAALVRNRFDPASEQFVYEAFVYDITEDEQGFIKTAQTKAEEYKYSEVTTNPALNTLCFLYTETTTDFKVEYVLTFSSLNMQTDGATWERDASDVSGKTWTIHIGTKDYTATITRLFGLGGLTFTEKTAPATT